MHKAKGHKGTLKRIKVTARRQLKRRPSYAGHLMSGKSGLRRQKLRRSKTIGGAMRRTMLKKLGYKTAWPYPPAAVPSDTEKQGE